MVGPLNHRNRKTGNEKNGEKEQERKGERLMLINYLVLLLCCALDLLPKQTKENVISFGYDYC